MKWIETQDRELVNVSKIRFLKYEIFKLRAFFNDEEYCILIEFDQNFICEGKEESKKRSNALMNKVNVAYEECAEFLSDEKRSFMSLHALGNVGEK